MYHRVNCDVEHSMPIVLGTGNFSHVYRAVITSSSNTSRVVAVKRLNGLFERVNGSL